ncbi:MAG TPA: F0F1 ATP synthase subunit epsilon [Chloroflexi bacterium]|nr:F0F1 ATP synthase subunit epsilon [Chloroflexota bacterium]
MSEDVAKTMHLEIATPDEIVLHTDVEAIRVQLSDGWWGILPGHAPFLAQIVAGIMLYRQQGTTHYVALYQGTIEVQRRSAGSSQVLVLTAAIEEGQDLATLERALEQQRARWNQIAQEAHIEFTRARMALERALRETAELAPLGRVVI